jgi:hypothetical protein
MQKARPTDGWSKIMRELILNLRNTPLILSAYSNDRIVFHISNNNLIETFFVSSRQTTFLSTVC